MKSLKRETKESTVKVSLGQAAKVDTGLPFFVRLFSFAAFRSAIASSSFSA